jgi:addiction module HigA family antidote
MINELNLIKQLITMFPKIERIKGMHPGAVLKWALNKYNIQASQLSEGISEHKQTLSAILNEKRGINPTLSIKLGAYFKIRPEYFMLIQAEYQVQSAINAQNNNDQSPKPKIRKVIFWDTDFEKLDWRKNKKAIIERVKERGNKKEIEEVLAYYKLRIDIP